MLPLIDIVFLLLVFFIYAMLSMVVHRGVKVELPRAATSQVDKREFVGLTLTRDNQVFLEEQRVPLDRLVDRVAARMAGKRDMPVFLRGDSRADLGVAIRVLDLLRAAGIREVSFECEEALE